LWGKVLLPKAAAPALTVLTADHPPDAGAEQAAMETLPAPRPARHCPGHAELTRRTPRPVAVLFCSVKPWLCRPLAGSSALRNRALLSQYPGLVSFIFRYQVTAGSAR